MSHRTFETELLNWQAAGRQPQLWWRDDDAVSVTAELERLTQLAGRSGVDVLLAVIPAYAEVALADYAGKHGHLQPCVHGWSHTNHAPSDEKKCELGAHRDLEIVLREIAAGRQRLAELFGSGLVPVLVPPWNRMRDDLAPRLGEIGIKAFSTFAHKRSHPEIQANTHVDVMDWKVPDGPAGKAPDQVLSELADALRTSRLNGFYPVGILTHHLVHDDAVWSSLSRLLAISDLAWVTFEDALGHQPSTTS